MIEIRELANILQFAISATLLLVVLFKLWPSFRLDLFRQKMFVVRDELFDYALAENIDFSHPAYGLLRRSMNAYIRYGHQLTFFRLCLTLLEWKFSTEKPGTQWFDNWNTAVNSISDRRVQTELRRFHSRALALVLKRILLGSPVLMLAVLAMTLYLIVRKGLHNVRHLVKMAAKTVLSSLIDPRLIEEEAIRCAA